MARGRKNRIGEQFAARTIEMLRSPAYRTLSLSAHRILARLEIELAQHGGRDNGKLPVTYLQFAAYGIDHHSIAPAIREVVALGFVKITQVGRAGNAEFRTPSKYRLTYKPADDLPPTNDWKRIETRLQAQIAAKIARERKSATKRQGGKRPLLTGISPIEKNKTPVGETPTTE